MNNKFEDFELIRNKNHLKNPADGSKSGGFYRLNSETYVVKNLEPIFNIREYVGSNIARLIVGDNAPVVMFHKDSEDRVYTSSKFIKGFKTLNKFLIEDFKVPEECFLYTCNFDINGSINILSYKDQEADFISPAIKGGEIIEVLAQLIGCSDTYNYNRGVINDSEASLIDYGSCFKDFFDSKNYIKKLS